MSLLLLVVVSCASLDRQLLRVRVPMVLFNLMENLVQVIAELFVVFGFSLVLFTLR